MVRATRGFVIAALFGLATPMISWTAGPSLASLRSGELVTNNAAVDEFINNDVSQVAANDDHACALRLGVVYCWGLNSSGQLGDGTTDRRLTPTRVTESAQQPGFTNTAVTFVATGYRHTCAIERGQVFCWGDGSRGKIGDGVQNWNSRLRPMKVANSNGFTNSQVMSVSAGWEHTCAIEAGSAFCWGDNQNGRLGDGSTDGTTSPVAVAANGGFLNSNVSAISAGGYHTCALRLGVAFCWGSNGGGQIGDGALYTDRWTPAKVFTSAGLRNEGDVTSITAGFNQLSCLVESGVAYCWGHDHIGIFGGGFRDSPVKLSDGPVFTNSGVTKLDVGRHLCLIRSAAMSCAGYNDGGSLGDGTFVNRSSPVLVTNSATNDNFTNDELTDVSIGAGTTCAIRVGVVYCWGWNYEGQLGSGVVTSDRPEGLSVPVRVSGGIAAPGRPTIVTGDGEVTVTWPRVGGVAEYTVTGSPAGTCTVSAPTTSCVITGLANGTPHTFTVVASLGSRASSPSSPSAPIAPGPIPTRPPRPATGTPPPITVSIGGDSVSAPIALSRGRFQPGVKAVFLARNTDAVAGTAAGIKGGPLFTFGLGGLDDETREEILRLQPKNLVLMGDTSSISIDIGDLLDELADTSLDHVAGVDRYDTAAKLTETTHPFGASVVYVANGIVLADAISGGPAASLENAPVLLVRPHAIPQITVESLRRLKPERIVVLGQTDAVSKEVERRLQEFAPTVERIGGVDRVVTAVAVSQQRFPFGARTIYVTTVDEIDLAGVAVPVASVDRAPVLFSPADCLPTVVRTEIQRLGPTRIVTFGGFAVDDVLGLPDC